MSFHNSYFIAHVIFHNDDGILNDELIVTFPNPNSVFR